MFKCDVCKNSVGPKVKANRVITQTARQEYHNVFSREDEYGNRQKIEVASAGHEIKQEQLVCNQCLGIDAPGTGTLQRGGKTFEEKQASPIKNPLILVAIENLRDRIFHESVRAKREANLIVPQIKQYTDLHKELVF